MKPRSDNDFDPKLAALIKRKVARIVGVKRHDREDIGQEASLHLIQQLPRHDPSRAGVVTFADRVVGNIINTTLRGLIRRKHRLRERPLECSYHVKAGVQSPAQIDLALDVKTAMAGMDPDHADVAGSFMDGYRVADVVRTSGRSRQQVRSIAKKLAYDLAELAPGRK